MFYAEYGVLVHQLLAGYYAGSIRKEDLPGMFMSGFVLKIRGAISPEIRRKFFNQGLECMNRIEPCPLKIVGIEQEVHFRIDDYPFTGYMDMLLQKPDGGFILVDHKSHQLKPRSNRKNPTKADQELYLYSAWVEKQYGTVPDELVFHCYRTGEIIREKFDHDAYARAKSWAVDLIHKIEATEDYNPNLDFFSCRYLCGVHEDCIYSELGG